MPIENVIDTTELCRFCVMCRQVTPVGHVTQLETLTPRGFGLIISSVRRGLLGWNAETVNVLYSASDTGLSQANCATDQPLPAAIAAARAEVAAAGLAPQMAYTINDKLKTWSNPYADEKPHPPEGTGEIGLFIGDAAYYLWPEALEAALTLLKAVGIDPPPTVGVGRNNGYLASSLGFPETAEALMQATVREVKAAGIKKLLVLSAGDAYALGQMNADRLGVAWPEGLEIVELTLYLDQQVREGKLQLLESDDLRPYAYVDPTHAVRFPERHGAPRRLVDVIKHPRELELFWRMQRAHPTGHNALQFTQPEIAEKLTRARLQDAVDVGAEQIICDSAGDLKQLSLYAAEYEVEVAGLYELLAEHIKH